MSKQAALGLAIARYGLYLTLFASHAVGQRALPQDRLILLAVVLLALAAVGYILTEHCRSQRLALALMGLEIGLIFANRPSHWRGLVPNIVLRRSGGGLLLRYGAAGHCGGVGSICHDGSEFRAFDTPGLRQRVC